MKLEAEAIEPIKNLSRYMKRSFKDLGRDELVDLIHTLVLAASIAKTDEGRRIHVSSLVGILEVAAKSIGKEFAEEMMESANSVSLTLQEALELIYRNRCKTCPDQSTCPDGGGTPPVIH